MQRTSISSGCRIDYLASHTIDWHDRPIAGLLIISGQNCLLHFLIAWDTDSKEGIRLYFSIDREVGKLVLDFLDLDWDFIKMDIIQIIDDLRVLVAVSLEREDFKPVSVSWVKPETLERLSPILMDVDSTFNNPKLNDWKELAVRGE